LLAAIGWLGRKLVHDRYWRQHGDGRQAGLGELVIFTKSPTCICGPNDYTGIPQDSSEKAPGFARGFVVIAEAERGDQKR
jgi:hypothetical protein